MAQVSTKTFSEKGKVLQGNWTHIREKCNNPVRRCFEDAVMECPVCLGRFCNECFGTLEHGCKEVERSN